MYVKERPGKVSWAELSAAVKWAAVRSAGSTVRPGTHTPRPRDAVT